MTVNTITSIREVILNLRRRWEGSRVATWTMNFGISRMVGLTSDSTQIAKSHSSPARLKRWLNRMIATVVPRHHLPPSVTQKAQLGVHCCCQRMNKAAIKYWARQFARRRTGLIDTTKTLCAKPKPLCSEPKYRYSTFRLKSTSERTTGKLWTTIWSVWTTAGMIVTKPGCVCLLAKFICWWRHGNSI
jgi:hypothetical protein